MSPCLAQFIPCDVATVCFGMAASMGAFLLGAGSPGKRKSLPNSRIMIHQPLGGAAGQAADIEIQVWGCIMNGSETHAKPQITRNASRFRSFSFWMDLSYAPFFWGVCLGIIATVSWVKLVDFFNSKFLAPNVHISKDSSRRQSKRAMLGHGVSWIGCVFAVAMW